MIHQEQQGSCNTLQAVQSLEDILEETLRITEKILSQAPVAFPGLDSWNEEIEAENFYHTDKISDLYKSFRKVDQDFNKQEAGWCLAEGS
jgi:hypothetical protein